MDENEFEDYDRDAELALYREYRDVVKMFRFVVETERRFYLANDVELKRVDTATDFYFELNMQDVWVWDIYRTDRFVKQVKVMTFKDVNVEEIGNRDDVLRTLDRILGYYARHEPSSPVPVLLNRARSLVSADFATIVRNLIPEGISQFEKLRGPEGD